MLHMRIDGREKSMCGHLHMQMCPGSYTHTWCRPRWLRRYLKHAQESPSCVLRHANTHTSRYFTKTPVIQNTQIGWQAATCVSQVLTDSKTMSCQTEMSYVFVSGRQASRQVSQGRKSRAVGRQRYGASKSKEGKGRKANLSTLQTTSSAARINTFTYRHSLGRHIYRQLSVTSVTSLYLSFFPPHL